MISCDLEELAPSVAASKTDGQFDIQKWGKEGLEFVPPLWLLKYLPNMPACHISIIHDIQGPSNSITCAEVIIASGNKRGSINDKPRRLRHNSWQAEQMLRSIRWA